MELLDEFGIEDGLPRVMSPEQRRTFYETSDSNLLTRSARSLLDARHVRRACSTHTHALGGALESLLAVVGFVHAAFTPTLR